MKIMYRLVPVFVIPIFIFALSLGGVVLANEDTSRDLEPKSDKLQKAEKFLEKRADLKVDFKEKKEQVREKFASKSAELRQKRADHIKKVLSLVLERLVAASERLDKIAQRIQTRIDKIKDRGVDVSAAQAALDSCDSKVASVTSALAIAKTGVDSLNPDGAEFKSQVEAARSFLKNVKLALLDYHTCLRNTLATIKAITPKEVTAGEE